MGVVHPTKLKTRLACILEAGESTRLGMEESLLDYHEDHVAGWRTIHYNIKIWFTNFIPMPEAMKIPAAKAAVDKELGKIARKR